MVLHSVWPRTWEHKVKRFGERFKKMGISWSHLEDREVREVLLQFIRVNTTDWGIKIQFYKSLFQVRCLFIVVKDCVVISAIFQACMSEAGFL